MVRKILLIFLLILFRTSFGRETFLIGFSQCGEHGDWRKNMEAEMERELMFHNDLRVITKQAGESSALQISQIREFVEEGIDLLIVAPYEISPVQEVIEEIYQMGIPVVLIDRKIDSEQYIAYVGGDNYEIGNIAGVYIANKLNYQGEVVEILGTLSSTPFIERKEGFEHALHPYSNLKSVFKNYISWSAQNVRDSLPLILKKYPNVKAIFSHTDIIAAIASQVLKDHFPDRNILIVGVDGLPNKGGGIQLVEDGIITATLIYPTGGKEAIQIASEILHGQPFQKNNLLPTTLIDKDNVRITRLQYNNIEALQKDITRSKNMLDRLGGRYKNQQLWLLTMLFLLLVVGGLSFMLFRAFKNMKKQKEAISIQNQELIRISGELEEATQAKLHFYTNISHEFRTPLTLIMGPLEKLMKSTQVNEKFKREFRLMHRNSSRLLRLVNQLMDFRKVETHKMNLRAGQYNLVAFLNEICDSFNELTRQKEIDLQVIADKEELSVWFDWDKLDKVIFNLLSNAFKFTPQRGTIHILVHETSPTIEGAHQKEVCIEVRDNGEGIQEEHLDKIFDRFYQVEKSGSFKGTGIGLSLSKEFILLHKGTISVESKVGFGTSFKIRLPLGNSHLKEEEMIVTPKEFVHDAEVVVSELKETKEKKSGKPEEIEIPDFGEEKPVILIVEDQLDMREYIRSCFDEAYSVLEAENGRQGLKIVEEEEPDIIISDVMMPEMDGLELTRRIKSELKYCHIPVILLTAKSTLEHELEGLEEGADSYITKPFSEHYLQLRVRKLLEAQQKIREKYRDSFQLYEGEKGLSHLDKDFLEKLSSLILETKYQEKVNVEDFSQKLGISRVHLYRKIKKLTGISVSEFVKIVRLKKSLELLNNSGKNVAEIAYEVGFSSPSYYTKCFKDQFKMSPTEFRQKK